MCVCVCVCVWEAGGGGGGRGERFAGERDPGNEVEIRCSEKSFSSFS